ncbi:hypothetical protein M501DRAFT_1039717 [Patellaria atrata CBS 101060]|uniref:Uncharacterized protein n=1 Tax=Patellaria atrata CBS 101060 TaxID=1346257 RepID=A0A9P4S6E7_9PEZI|nr:hypothetical protein M501DRAFT_1039717 [Patellaria atrata CBS 101060]
MFQLKEIFYLYIRGVIYVVFFVCDTITSVLELLYGLLASDKFHIILSAVLALAIIILILRIIRRFVNRVINAIYRCRGNPTTTPEPSQETEITGAEAGLGIWIREYDPKPDPELQLFFRRQYPRHDEFVANREKSYAQMKKEMESRRHRLPLERLSTSQSLGPSTPRNLWIAPRSPTYSTLGPVPKEVMSSSRWEKRR